MNVQEPITYTRFLKNNEYISKVIDIYLNNEHLFSIATYSMTAKDSDTEYPSFHTYRNSSEGDGLGLVGFFQNFDLIHFDDTHGTIANFKFYILPFMFTFFKSSIPEDKLIETIVNSDEDPTPYKANKFNIIYPANNMGGVYKNGNIQSHQKFFLTDEVVVINNGSIIGLYFPNENVKKNSLTDEHYANKKSMKSFFNKKKHTTAITLLCERFGMENCTTFDTFFYNLNNNEEYKRTYYDFDKSEIELTYSEPIEIPLITSLNGVPNPNPTQQVVLNYLKEVIGTGRGDYTFLNRNFSRIMQRIQQMSLDNKPPAEIIKFLQNGTILPRETNVAASIIQNIKRNGDAEEEIVVNGKRPIERDEPEGKKQRGGMRNTKNKRRNTKNKRRNTKHKKRNTIITRNTKHKKY